MKKICIFIAIFFILGQLKGQQDNQLNNILVESILLNLDYDVDLYNKVSGNRKDSRAYTLPYICKDGLPSHFPYDSLQHINFFSLNNVDGQPNFFKKKLKKGMSAWFVGIKLTNNVITITISDEDIKRIKKNRVKHVVGFHWGIYTYEYSCEKQEWKLKDVKHTGI